MSVLDTIEQEALKSRRHLSWRRCGNGVYIAAKYHYDSTTNTASFIWMRDDTVITKEEAEQYLMKHL